jgi:hypothetical protein
VVAIHPSLLLVLVHCPLVHLWEFLIGRPATMEQLWDDLIDVPDIIAFE